MRFRSVFLFLHRWTDLFAGLLLALTGLTGSLLLFGEESEKFLNPGLQQVTPRQQRVSLQAILESVRQGYPNERSLAIRLPRSASDVYEFWMNGREGPRIYVDPYSGALLGVQWPVRTLMGFLFFLHTDLLAGEIGETTIGIGGLLLVLLSVTGLVLWWPGMKKWGQGFVVRTRGTAPILTYDLHKTVGWFTLALLTLIAATGTAMTFYPTSQRAIAGLTGFSPHPQPTSGVKPGLTPLPLDEILSKADQVMPDAITTWVVVPTTPHEIVKVRKKFAQELHPNGRSFVSLDQYNGQVLLVEHALQAPLGTRLDNLLYPLHIGSFGGATVRLLYTITGLAPALLFATGLFLWRWKQKQRRAL